MGRAAPGGGQRCRARLHCGGARQRRPDPRRTGGPPRWTVAPTPTEAGDGRGVKDAAAAGVDTDADADVDADAEADGTAAAAALAVGASVAAEGEVAVVGAATRRDGTAGGGWRWLERWPLHVQVGVAVSDRDERHPPSDVVPRRHARPAPPPPTHAPAVKRRPRPPPGARLFRLHLEENVLFQVVRHVDESPSKLLAKSLTSAVERGVCLAGRRRRKDMEG